MSKHDCEACIHKVVCALWEIQNELCDNECAYYQPTLTPPNEWVSVEDRLPETAGEYLVVYHPCYWDNVSAEICVGIDSFRGKTAWAKKKYQRVTHWMLLPAPPDRRPPEGEEDT